MRRYFKVLWPLYVSEFFRSLVFIAPIWILFFQSRGLNLEQIGFVATGTYLGSFLFEYPSGVFADRLGRKNSIFVSIILSTLALFVELNSYSTYGFFIAAFFGGMSWAFASGAREAFIYDKLKEHKLQRFNSEVTGTFATVFSMGILISSLFGSIIFVIDKTYPYWCAITSDIVSIFFLFLIKETNFKEGHEAETTLYYFKEGMKNVWKIPLLKSLILLYVPLFFFEEAWYNAQQPILIGLGLPVALLGAYVAGRTILTGILGIYLPKVVKKFNYRKLLLLLIILQAVAWYLMGGSNLYAVILSAYIMMQIHQFWNYIDADIIHKHISSHVRASTISARQMLISTMFIPVPWFLGYLVNNYPRKELFAVFAFTTLTLSLIIYFARRKWFK